MKPLVADKSRRKKHSESIQGREPAVLRKESIHSQPVSPPDDIQARISDHAYELYAERGYRQGYALEDWLEAERAIRGPERNA
ncbi:MAG: DUF2934 domain-containing protein [Nitrospira sp.]|nr:DUF2934 domain-containing protein [Nitrospira sp.]MBS0153470.1 DUF2934 domain-containing protein [Nitrospira sp.]MBS0165091.1 DUF2934 domain-containing protein [Nitrospira sp.]MBX3324868.1 DUF2934 domain-containing protein [Nitrospira sp.]